MAKLILVWVLTFFGSMATAKAIEPLVVKDYPQTNTLSFVTESFPPFQYLKEGEIVGGMYDVMVAVCAEAKINCTFALESWPVALEKGETGQADVLFSILMGVKERTDKFIVSTPVVMTGYSFFVASDSAWKWKGDPNDLTGMTIGVCGPSGTAIVAQSVLRYNPKATLLVEPKSNLQVFQNLLLGKYGNNGAIVVNTDVGLALMKMNSISGPKVAGGIKPAALGFGLSRASPNKKLFSRFVSSFITLQENGTVAKILKSAESPLIPTSSIGKSGLSE